MITFLKRYTCYLSYHKLSSRKSRNASRQTNHSVRRRRVLQKYCYHVNKLDNVSGENYPLYTEILMVAKYCSSQRIIFIIIFSCIHKTYTTTTSHTFFYTPPNVTLPMLHSFFDQERPDVFKNEWWPGGAIEAVPYVSHSVQACKLAQYFMPFGKTVLNVSEYKPSVPSSTSDLQPCKDIEARHFNIETNPNVPEAFASTITLAPQHRAAGIAFTFQQALYRSHIGNKPRLWLEISFPVEEVTHCMNFREDIIETGGGAVDALGLDNAPRVGSMTAAFQQPSWNFGKINNCSRKAHGVADVTFTLNWSSYTGRCFNTITVGFIAPTGTKINAQQAAYVFSPVIGNNHHWAFTLGGRMCFDLWECRGHMFKFYYDSQANIIIGNHQVRSFDIIGKSWSRYMETYASQMAAETAQTNNNFRSGTSGINLFTRCVEVDPRYDTSASTAIAYQYRWLMAEIGANIYTRHAEIINFNCWNDRIAFKDVNGNGATNLARTIGKNFPSSAVTDTGDYVETLVKLSDINFDSMAHPGIISTTIYGGLGYEWNFCRIPVIVGIGNSYEFSSRNVVLNRWSAWGKASITY